MTQFCSCVIAYIFLEDWTDVSFTSYYFSNMGLLMSWKVGSVVQNLCIIKGKNILKYQ